MKYFRMITFTVLALLANMAHAASIDWWFTNSGQSWSPTDTIALEASMLNTGTDSLNLGQNGPLDSRTLGLGNFPWILAQPYGYSFEFNYLAPGFGEDKFLPSGESLDFIFGWFIPQTDIPMGYYEIGFAYLETETMVINSLNLFNVTVVPIPAALWLFITGLIGLYGFSRRGN